MSKIGRNDPCRCGSSKKYKKCCLPKQEAAVAFQIHPDRMREQNAFTLEEDDLDEVSNSVIDLIAERRFDEALVVCNRLLREYPDVNDGFERFAMVHEAMGNHVLAGDYYRKALEFIEQPEMRDGYDPREFEYYREKIAAIDTLTKSTTIDGG